MTGRVWRWQHSLPLLVIGLVVVVANGPSLFGWVDPNPLNFDSGLAAVTHPGLLMGLPVTDPNAGFTAQALGHLVALDWLGGHVPWWNPFEGLGSPLAGEMQSGAFFPPNLLLYFSNGQEYVHALLELIAGLTTYALLTELRLGRLAATSGALLCALCGTFAWFGHAAANPVAFLPMLVWGIERAANRGRGTVIIALALALSLYAGFPETAYIDALLAAAWTVARIITTPERRRFVLLVGAGAGAGLLLAAPILIAFADYLPAANLGANASLYSKITLTARAAPTLFVPYIYGPIDAFNGHDPTGTLNSIWLNVGGYLGLPMVVLGTIGAFSRRHRVLVIALLAWLLLALGRTFGLDGITPLVNALPGMTHVQFSRYAEPSMVMAGLTLAVIGLDRIGRGRVPRPQLLAGTGAGLLVLALSVLQARGLLHRLHGAADHWAWTSIGWATFTVVALSVAALVLRGRARLLTLAALVALDALALFVVPELSAPRGTKVYLGPVTYLEAHLGTSRFFTVGPIAPDYGSYFGLSSLAVDDVPTPSGYDAYMARQLGSPPGPFAPATTSAAFFRRHLGAFERAGVRYLVTPGNFTLPATGPTLRRVFSGPSGDVFEVPHPTAFYAAPGCQLSDEQFDSVHVNCATASDLVRKEVSMRGWSAIVNGTPAAVTSDGDLERVHLPQGTTTVIFQFTPPYTDLAVAAFGLGLLGLLAVLAVARRPKPALRRFELFDDVILGHDSARLPRKLNRMEISQDAPPMSVPWIESPEFEVEFLKRTSGLTPWQRELAQNLHRDGYAVMKQAVTPELCDQIRAEVEPLFENESAQTQRRVPDAWRQGATSVRALAVSEEIQADLAALYGRRAIPFQTLNFKWGTEQGFHADAIHFTSMPDRFMCGVWVALEDVDDSNGPLAYLPGSHRIPQFATAEIGIDPDRFARAEPNQLAVMESIGIQPVEFHAKKGDALIWTATVLHGGRPIKDEASTRWSQVTHYYFEDCIYYQPIYSSALTGEVKLMEIVDLNDLQPVPQRYEGLDVVSQRLANGRCLLSVIDGAGNEIIGSALHVKHLQDQLDAARLETQELRRSASFRLGNVIMRPLSRAVKGTRAR